MHAFTDLVAGMIFLGDMQDFQTLVTSTTQLTSTILAEALELAFLQYSQTARSKLPPVSAAKSCNVESGAVCRSCKCRGCDEIRYAFSAGP